MGITNTNIGLVLQISILAITIYYLIGVEKKLVRVSLLTYALFISIPLINILLGDKILSDIFYFLIYISIYLFFLTHLIIERIALKDKILLFLILLAGFIKLIITIFHIAIAEVIPLVFTIAIGLIVYLNLKRLNDLRDELRFMDILGIFMIMDLIF